MAYIVYESDMNERRLPARLEDCGSMSPDGQFRCNLDHMQIHDICMEFVDKEFGVYVAEWTSDDKSEQGASIYIGDFKTDRTLHVGLGAYKEIARALDAHSSKGWRSRDLGGIAVKNERISMTVDEVDLFPDASQEDYGRLPTLADLNKGVLTGRE